MMIKPKTLLLSACVLAAIGIIALVVDYSQSRAAAADDQQPVTAQVVTQAVEQRSLANSLSVFGDVAPARMLVVSSTYPAQVTRLLVIQGQMVSKGSPLAVLVGDPASQLAYQQALSAAQFSRSELERMRQLSGLQLATQSQLEAAQKSFDDAQAAVIAQKKLGGNTGATLTAPEDSVVMALTVAQGDRVAAGTPMMQLGAIGTLKVLLGIDPADRQRVKKGAQVTVAPLGSADDKSDPLQGSVIDVQDAIDAKTQLTNVVVRIDPSDKRFVPGMRVRAEIQAEQRNAFVVQRQAVLNDDKGAYLFQVEQKKARRVEVRTVIDNRNILGVTGNIDPHAPVVISGNYELENGMSVREAGQ